MSLPHNLARLALEIEGWLELGAAERALRGLEPLIAHPGARPIGMQLRCHALVALGRFEHALRTLDTIRRESIDVDTEWLEVQDAWCRKRLDDLPGAVAAMYRLLRHDPRSAIAHYNLGCYLALQGHLEESLNEVTVACGLDETFRRHAVDETDLDGLRGDERFEALLRRDGPAPG